MRVLSDSAITKADVEAAVAAVDAAQNRQIKQLRIVVGASFAVNVALSIALYFLK